jgi:hypothetical protein
LRSRDAFWRQRPLTTLSLGHAGKQAPGFGRDECAWRGHRVIQKLPAIGLVLAAVNHRRIGDVTRFQNAVRPCSWAGLAHHSQDGPAGNPGVRLTGLLRRCHGR